MLWAFGAHTLWVPLGDRIEHASELLHSRGNEAGVVCLPTPIPYCGVMLWGGEDMNPAATPP